LSLPDSPLRTSAQLPPIITSLPAPPSIVSAPASPERVLFPLLPIMMLSAALPVPSPALRRRVAFLHGEQHADLPWLLRAYGKRPSHHCAA
jgi:hypothetical protein